MKNKIGDVCKVITMLGTLDVQLVFKFSGQNFEDDISKFEWILAGKGDVHKSQNCNFRSGLYVRSTVRLFDANNNFKMTIGPSMNHVRDYHGCAIYHSSVHSDRPVIVTAGGGQEQSSEIWDFTVPGSQWHISKYFGLSSKGKSPGVPFHRITSQYS